MKYLSLVIIGLSLAGAVPAADYKVGERLKESPGIEVSGYREMTWDDLLPKGWDPMTSFKGLDLAKLKDSDPRATEALAQMRQEWDNAPVNHDIKGQAVRIAGFLVPLEWSDKGYREFLLVPYFGACIHVPPPPANQIIHVFSEVPVSNKLTMDGVWVSGVIDVEMTDTSMGRTGYRMKAKLVKRYEDEKKR
jgi:hypothetical protein